MKHILAIAAFLYSILLMQACIEPIDKTYSKLPPGKWRAVLQLDNAPYVASDDEEVSVDNDFNGELPFNFEVKYTDAENFYIEIINGEERIRVDDIKYGRDKATAKDTVIIDFPIFDSYIKAIYEDEFLEGNWYVNYRDGYAIPFKATFGQSHRFTTLRKTPLADLSGRWQAKFEIGTPDEYPAIADFVQNGNELQGTFLTETGDYRFLEGTVQGNKLYLSVFDGSHAFLFEGKIQEDGMLIGSFRSGKHYTTSWEAKKDDGANLANSYELSSSTIGEKPLEFTFPDVDGNMVSLSDSRFEDKIKLVKISGTWCPNCKDEALFLKNWLASNPSDDVEVIEISFERYKDDAKNIASLKRYKSAMDVPFTILYGGHYDKSNASSRLPQIDKVLAYPTLLFVDKDNRLKKIYTGFNGPATSEYKDFVVEFDQLISELRRN